MIHHLSIDLCSTPAGLLWFVVDLLYKWSLQLCRSWQDFDWHSRASSRLTDNFGSNVVGMFSVVVGRWWVALHIKLICTKAKLTPPRQTRHRYDCFVLLCLVWRCELSRLDRQSRQTGAFCVWSVSECVRRRNATAGRTRTQNALVGPTQFATTDTTRLDRRACLSTAAATQARQAGTPAPRPHAATLYTSQNNFFSKRHTTRVIYRLTVQTLPDVCGTVYRLL